MNSQKMLETALQEIDQAPQDQKVKMLQGKIAAITAMSNEAKTQQIKQMYKKFAEELENQLGKVQ